MRERRIHLVILLTLGVVVAGGWLASAGPLTPPPGPVVSRGRFGPRVEINAVNTPGDADSLFKITAPGSYYVSGNITGVGSKHGIEIAASGVTLDLNGFTLDGGFGPGDTLDGVNVVAGTLDVTVRNGTLRNWEGHGVFAPAGVGPIGGNHLFENLRVSGIAQDVGLLVGNGCTITDCVAHNNQQGISAGNGCTIRNCTAYFNNGLGIETGNHCTVTDCTALSTNGFGMKVGTGCTVVNCSSSSNCNSGIVLGARCTLTSSTFTDNDETAIVAGTGSKIIGCTVGTNNFGIEVSGGCLVKDNNIREDGMGIGVTGSDNRIEGNNVVGSLGISVAAAGDFIAKNTVSSAGTAYSIVAGNSFGPIVNVAGVGDISGTVNANHPWANFEY